MVDEHPPTDVGARMNLDAREPAAPVRQPPRQPARPEAPQTIDDHPVPDERMQPRVAGQYLPRRARRRVALENHVYIFTQSIEHDLIFPYPSESLKYCLPTIPRSPTAPR